MLIRRISAKVKCPRCRKAHFWNRKQAMAFSERKSVLLPCMFCGCKYWVKKSGCGVVINEAKEADYGIFQKSVSYK